MHFEPESIAPCGPGSSARIDLATPAISMSSLDLDKMQLTSGSVQSAMAVVTLEMLSFLMRDENLQVIKVTFTVVAPWAIEELLERRTASFFAHCSVNVNRNKVDSNGVDRDKGDFKNRKRW